MIVEIKVEVYLKVDNGFIIIILWIVRLKYRCKSGYWFFFVNSIKWCVIF